MVHRRRLVHGIIAAALLAAPYLWLQPAAATTIGFDNITDTSGGTFGTPIANGYQGLNWNNFFVLDTGLFTTNVGPNGAALGTTSPPNVAFNGNGDVATFTSATPFTLTSAQMTAFWNDGLQVTVQGLLNGTVIDSVTFTVDSTGPTLENFNFSGIDEVDIATSGGTQNLNYAGAGTELAIDDLVISPFVVSVPEPSTSALLSAGLIGFGLIRRRRRKAS